MDESTFVLVPMFNEATVVGGVVRALRAHFANVVCVDDGSRDDSFDVARDAGAVALRHPVNLGQGAALQTGFDFLTRRALPERTVTFDADGQHRVEDAVAMVEASRRSGVDVLLGSRALGSATDQPVARRLLLAAALRYSRWSTGLDLTDTHNGLRVLSRRAVELIRLRQPGMAYATELESIVGRSGLSWAEHPTTIAYTEYSRAKGQSNLNAFNILCDLTSQRLRSAS
ncbi:glycosyltransferase [Nocardioides sp. zg-579]|uniref:Glycosyltransferase n=1 Tax=Nocardioides marmotae TaxID=2663857 RepID=A0A6I3JBQ2_9ACTN|nr:glycosyltransferase family 2 protein [Nocardioides marmotae]MCR6031895.1 glycosyltransferase [Gordonia jinghuaiqii]MTB95535.1 glycosyltransferase [Nocardioides marmotae]QKE00959.1 glycosyltransferase family 2 protein [Nocardioides marmotae]